MIKVAIADDHKIVRDAIKFIIEQDNNIEVLWCAANGKEAVELCEKFTPDIILMDISMPEIDGIEATGIIKHKYSEVKIIILTTFHDNDSIQQAFKNNASGYVLKDTEPEKLIAIIYSVFAGMQTIDERIFGSISEKFISEKSAKDNLTDREMDILRLIVFGKSNKQIAKELDLSVGYVANVISNILTKLDLEDRTQLAIYAVKQNVI